MYDKIFKIAIVVVVIGAVVIGVVLKEDRPELVRPGNEQDDNGAAHVAIQDAPAYNGAEPPTSGDHGQHVGKGAYQSELSDFNIIHNLEHGYIYITYQPDLPQDEINRLESLFFSPFSNPDFSPSKVIMAPRAANDSLITLSSWQRSQNFESMPEDQVLVDYYLRNVNKSPEPLAQ